MTVVPLLTYPDVNKPYILYVDASDTCCGACLCQNEILENGEIVEKPIHFISHKLNPTHVRTWSVVEKEAYAIFYALNKLHFYLHNAEFVIKSDHKPLSYLLNSEFKKP